MNAKAAFLTLAISAFVIVALVWSMSARKSHRDSQRNEKIEIVSKPDEAIHYYNPFKFLDSIEDEDFGDVPGELVSEIVKEGYGDWYYGGLWIDGKKVKVLRISEEPNVSRGVSLKCSFSEQDGWSVVEFGSWES